MNWLRAFEAAARHMSFKNAAEELNVTPAAISQQMRQLEDYYEVRLFDRSPRGLTFTRVGMLAAPLLTAAMSTMESACDAMKNHGKKDVLVVTAPPSFSMKWLIPRLEDFRERHPDIEIRIDARRADGLQGWLGGRRHPLRTRRLYRRARGAAGRGRVFSGVQPEAA
ncbi:LysR family transcriptional regulator [Breoghania sp. L-A4]|uniref:LysR family transcriptional regulator n=1 Tax=Breoghania sp. L-A4 TaxID=2304600 RepID=UPI0013C333AF|nr:LysR family transcriptional regulator [Breoghania sp. L-A4]